MGSLSLQRGVTQLAFSRHPECTTSRLLLLKRGQVEIRRNKLLVKLRPQPQVSAVFDSGSIRICANSIDPDFVFGACMEKTDQRSVQIRIRDLRVCCRAPAVLQVGTGLSCETIGGIYRHRRKIIWSNRTRNEMGSIHAMQGKQQDRACARGRVVAAWCSTSPGQSSSDFN